MQVSQKQKKFSEFFAAFSKYTLNFKNFQKRDDAHTFFIFEVTDFKSVPR